MHTITRRGAIGAGAALLAAGSASAQPAWPSRPIRLIVPFPPGGSNDLLARPLAEQLGRRLGQPVVVENRGGAGGLVGAGALAQAPADGYHLMVTSASFLTAGVVQSPAFRVPEDFTGVALLARSPFVILAAPDLDAPDIAALLRMIRERPGALNYGSAGPGSINQFVTEALGLEASLRMTHVPYRGMAPAITDLVAGRIQVLITTLPSAAGMIREGRVRLLAYTAAGAPDGPPAAPTLRDAGVAFDAAIWWGLFAPRGLPAPVLARLNAETNGALTAPEVRRLFLTEGAVPASETPEAFAAFLSAETARYRATAAAAGIRAGG
jgi:tripartite-type tricarboxylate transporter receptor subunit TctC